ncbi:hypothetical protein [Leptospira idonii]|uniref:Lipoprotein n=1 Tax=Leptospira idonii TaxID=1193500 RepID=A0A4R9LV37_9LEPT|nr:hypothetical protein [Leptospira idonii]TGN18028.1 hypothetical protein EHS15_15665 [Leptospira idonii]
MPSLYTTTSYLNLLTTLILISLTTQCSTVRKIYRSNRTDVAFSDFSNGKYSKQQKIVLRKITTKPSTFLSATKDNFTENLRFSLLYQGFQVEIADEESFDKAKKTEPSVFQKDTPLESPKDIVKEIIAKTNANIFIDGYIYEKDLGNVLDQDFSTGIILRIYNNDASLIGETILSSFYSSADFEVNQMYANLLAEKLALAYSSAPKSTWKPFLSK